MSWRTFGRGLKAPELLIVDGGKGLEAARPACGAIFRCSAARCTRSANLLAHAPKALHDEVKADSQPT